MKRARRPERPCPRCGKPVDYLEITIRDKRVGLWSHTYNFADLLRAGGLECDYSEKVPAAGCAERLLQAIPAGRDT